MAGWPAMLTPTQVQEVLGIDREQLFRLVATRTFPLVKRGRAYRIPARALLQWLAREADISQDIELRGVGSGAQDT